MKYKIVRRGHCKRCGVCEDKSISQPDKWAGMKPTGDPDVRLFNWKPYHRVCSDFSMVDGLACCAIYATRPEVCRTFPVGPEDLVNIKDCGYWFEVVCVP